MKSKILATGLACLPRRFLSLCGASCLMLMTSESGAADVKIGGGPHPYDQAASLVAVLATPATYERKVLVLKGFLIDGEGEYALFLSRDDARYSIQTNAIRVFIAGELRKRADQMVGRYVLVQGTFENKSSPVGGYQGELRNVTRVQSLTALDVDPDPLARSQSQMRHLWIELAVVRPRSREGR